MEFYLFLPNNKQAYKLGTLNQYNTFWATIGGGYTTLMQVLSNDKLSDEYLNAIYVRNDKGERIELTRFVEFLNTINVKKI